MGKSPGGLNSTQQNDRELSEDGNGRGGQRTHQLVIQCLTVSPKNIYMTIYGLNILCLVTFRHVPIHVYMQQY